MGVPQHRTRSVIDRYNISSQADLEKAVERLAEYNPRQTKPDTHNNQEQQAAQ